MFRRRDGQIECLTVVAKVDQIRMIAAHDCVFNLLIGLQRPIKTEGFGFVAVPFEQTQVVHDVAAAHDQHAFAAQNRQFFGQIVMRLRAFEMIQTQLHHRNIGIRVQMTNHRPCAVIQAPFILVQTDRRAGDELLCRLSQCGAAGRGVLHVKQRLRKAAEIVNGTRFRHGGEPCAARFPVRGDAQNGVRFGHFACECANRTTKLGVGDGVHRTAMPQKQRGHRLAVGKLLE